MAKPFITEQGDIDMGTIIPLTVNLDEDSTKNESCYYNVQQEFEKADDNLNPKVKRILDQLQINMNFMAANFPHDEDPHTFTQAMNSPDKEHWIEGMLKEY